MAKLLIDTHFHLDARVFRADLYTVVDVASPAIVVLIVIPVVEVQSFERTIECAHAFSQGYYALGIHPMYVPNAQTDDLRTLEEFLQRHIDDPRLVAVGEIGLDFFVPELRDKPLRTKQLHFYHEQLN